MKSKIALGTVQFGIPYGIANSSGQVLSSEVGKILDLAKKASIRTLDTAIAYGESESILGKYDLSTFSVVTKLPEIPNGISDIDQWIDDQITSSLARLNVSAIDSLLLHRPEQLLKPHGRTLYKKLQEIKSKGIVQRVGISIYEPIDLDYLMSYFDFDIVQTPFNIIDNRIIESGWYEKLLNQGVAIHVRSIFMQGLLLMHKKQRPAKFSRWNHIWTQWQNWLQESGQTPLEACLQHALSIDGFENIIVGVDSYTQLEQIIQASHSSYHQIPKDLQSLDTRLLNPSCWNTL